VRRCSTLEIVGTIVVSVVVAAWFVWLIAKPAHLEWGFWLLWVLASTVGLYSGGIVGFIGGYAVEAILPNYVGVALLAGVGAGVGICQWLVLRRRVSRAGWWVLASILGLAVAAFVSTAVALAGGYSAISENLVVGVGGAMAGIMQWFVLRRRVSRAGWWVLASTVGWAVSAAVLGPAKVPGGGVGLGAVTGLALIWLLRQPVPEA
jgi:hypothetical protein